MGIDEYDPKSLLTYSVSCDMCGEALGGDISSVFGTWATAALGADEAGWTRDGEDRYCPTCAPVIGRVVFSLVPDVETSPPSAE